MSFLKPWHADIPDGKACPVLKDRCIERKCPAYVELQGKHPQSGQDVREWGCVMGWLPMLLIENSRTNRETSGELSALRSENVTGSAKIAAALQMVATAASLAPGVNRARLPDENKS